LIINKGIFGKVYDTINLFIPENNMKGWTYDDNEECFVKKDQKINKKSNVDAIITDTKFTVTKYNCICSL